MSIRIFTLQGNPNSGSPESKAYGNVTGRQRRIEALQTEGF